MTQALLNLLEVIKTVRKKIIDFHGEIESENQCYVKYIEDRLDDELLIVSQQFRVTKSAALMLCAILDMYIKSDGIRINFITINDIKNFFHPEFFTSTIIFRDRIWELEEKNILELKDIDHYPVRIFYETDRTQNDYYLLPAKRSFMPFANKKIELTHSFINKLKQL